jgi:epoxyqueuosine reductase
MLIHDEAGLMISLRGAMRFAGEHAVPPEGAVNPCATCEERPCTTACPVGALSADAPYDVPTCKTHITSPAGEACMTGGCLVRRACPVSRSFGRDPEQSAFHMRAFVGA